MRKKENGSKGKNGAPYQMLGSTIDPDGKEWFLGVGGQGNLYEFRLMPDINSELLASIRSAVRKKELIYIPVIEFPIRDGFRRVGVQK